MNGRESPWPGPAEAFGLLLLQYMADWLAIASLHDINGLLGLTPSALGVLGSVLGTGAVLAGVMQWRGLGWRALMHDTPSSPVAMLGLLAAPLLMVVPALVTVNGVIIGALTAVFPLSDAERSMFEHMAESTLPTLLAACVLAPLLEELLFRGIVLRGFLQRFPRGQAIAMSAIVFGIAHLNLYQFVAATLIGAVLGWLYERTRSVLPGMLLHGAYNTTLIAMAHRDVSTVSLTAVAWAVPLGLATSAIGVALLRRLLLPSKR